MDKIEKIGREIREFSPSELAAFRKWFHDFDAEAWDRQIEEDVQAGKLDALAKAALKTLAGGECARFEIIGLTAVGLDFQGRFANRPYGKHHLTSRRWIPDKRLRATQRVALTYAGWEGGLGGGQGPSKSLALSPKPHTKLL